MGKEIDITGNKYNKLTAISYAGRKGVNIFWLFQCDCGDKNEMRKNSVTSGKTKGCRKCSYKDNLFKIKHGMWHHPAYNSWHGLKSRCNNTNNKDYSSYGGRGIIHDKKWEDFKGFWEDMGPSYFDGGSLDRINVNGNYCKINCRWTTQKVQANNRRNNKLFTFNKITLSVDDWAEKLNIKRTLIYGRLRKGWTIEDALTKQTNDITKNLTIK